MKIAVVGTGISGLGAAWLLHQQHEVHVYEKNNYIGGHSRTIEVQTPEGMMPVDTGFIVFNYRNYPNLTGLFSELNVPVEKSDMSFTASIADGWLEYGTQRAGSMFAQKRNLLRPAFWKMIADILRFNRQAARYLEVDSSVTLGQCLDELGMGSWFRNYYLLAVGGAIWSTPVQQMLTFPAKTFVRFFENHGLLTVNDQPQWHTVTGGSREYIKLLTASFAGQIRLNCGVVNVQREQDRILVRDSQGQTESYDHIIFACHADQALAMLETPSDMERSVLGRLQYQPNHIIVHSDTSFMPRHKQCWASWVYLSEQRDDRRNGVSLSYWMNHLQNLKTDMPIIVTLNPDRTPSPELVHDEYSFEHPQFDGAAIDAQAEIHLLQGKHNSWYCGAYQRYGFHEDGLLSAVMVAKQFGVTIPWE